MSAAVQAGRDLPGTARLLSGRDFWHLEPVPSEGIPPVLVTDGPHGVRRRADGAGSVPATCFPTGAALGATWDEDLLAEIGRALGRECRAHGVGVLLGPGLNLKRHPAGGRNFEYLAEDPLLSGRLAAALTRGIQSQGVGACPKHLAVNNQETLRMTVDAVVDERTLHELYLRGFEIVVRQGRPWAVMASYNRVNGTYAAESRWLLTDLLRDRWGFDGIVVSDWGAVDDRVAALRAGTDLEMPGGPGARDAEVVAAVRDGRLSRSTVDGAAERVVGLLRRIDRPDGTAAFDRDAHHRLARRAAAAGTVLLTNDGILPLPATGTVAVAGAFAAAPRYQGAGSARVTPTRVATALQALRDRLGPASVRYAPGYEATGGATTGLLLADAARAAREADAAVVVVGLPAGDEMEGVDRPHLRLPEGHTRLVEAVLAATDRVVVVLCNGGPVEMPWADRAAAVVEASLGGQAGGAAIADVLLGDAEPAGRLAESIPFAPGDLPADRWFPGRPRQVEHREGPAVGYRFHHTAGVPARFPFGHGLSYTSFRYGPAAVDRDGRSVTVSLPVTNTGGRPGSTVVQVYIRPVGAPPHRPDRELAGFATARPAPGETATVAVDLDPRGSGWGPRGGGDWVVEPGGYELLVGASSADVRGRATVEIPGEAASAAARPAVAARPAAPAAGDADFAARLGRPVPSPRPVRPFHRNSTVGDLRHSTLGRVVRAVLVRAAVREAEGELAGMAEDPAAMARAAVEQLPLRALVGLSGGRLPPAAVDGLVAALNGRWGRLLRGLLPGRRPADPPPAGVRTATGRR